MRNEPKVIEVCGLTYAASAVLMAAPRSKTSPSVLIVEDELLVALIIEEMTRDLGYRIAGVAHTLPMAHVALAKRNFDAVLLDVNINGHYCIETADVLMETGVPFAFLTGYDYLLEPRFEKIPLLEKPFTPHQLHALLQDLVGPPIASDEAAKSA